MRNALIACVVSFCISSFALGQIPGTQATGGPIATIPWMQPGLVISSTWMAAHYPGHATDFKQDEHGNWIGQDGARLQASNRAGTSASGISQSTITCVGDKLAVICTSSFADVRLLGIRDPQLQDFPRTYAISIGENDMWIDPAKLAQMRSSPAENTVVLPVKWKVGDKIVDAVRIQYVKPDHYMDHVYDLRSGLCLHVADSSTSAAPQLKYIAPGEAAVGDTLLSDFEFISLRVAHAPWSNEAIPPIARQFKAFHYAGEMYLPRATFPVAPTQLALDVTPQDSGKDWVSVNSESSVLLQGQRQMPGKVVFICGQDQYGTFFAGPGALAKLQSGQVLDTDPITHVQTTVAKADAQSVTIRMSSAGAELSRTYDKQTGKMIGFGRYDALSKMTTVFKLRSED